MRPVNSNGDARGAGGGPAPALIPAATHLFALADLPGAGDSSLTGSAVSRFLLIPNPEQVPQNTSPVPPLLSSGTLVHRDTGAQPGGTGAKGASQALFPASPVGRQLITKQSPEVESIIIPVFR